jgi:hypothetical protein
MMGLGVVGMMAALALGGCVVDESPVVGEDAGGAAGTGGSVGTGGSGAATAGDNHGYQSGSTTFFVNQVLDPPEEGGLTDVCLPAPLPIDAERAPTCQIYAVALREEADGGCACPAPQRSASPDAVATVREYLGESGRCDFGSAPACAAVCACEVPVAAGNDKLTCQNDLLVSEGAEGWCYISPEDGLGSPVLVSGCPQQQPRRVRFLETGAGPDDLYVIACAGSEAVPPGGVVDPKPLGDPCVPDDERRPEFNGFAASQVSVDTNAGCNSNVCLINHFQGRVSCPYGQSDVDVETERQCFIPGTDVSVAVPVEPQLIERRAEQAAVCSCRCAGDGPGPFCACPSDMECSPLVKALGLPNTDHLVGSYCIPRGTAYDPSNLNPETCNPTTANCGDAHPY